MPLKVSIKKVEIPDRVVDLVAFMAAKKIEKLEVSREAKKADAIRILSPIAQKDGKTWDSLRNVMSNLVYHRYAVEKTGCWRALSLVGYANIQLYNTGTKQTHFAGEYQIILPVEAYILAQPGRVEFINLRDPESYNRHPHHKFNWNSDGLPYTCWGTFSELMVPLIETGTPVDVMRTLGLFASTDYPASRLCHAGPWTER